MKLLPKKIEQKFSAFFKITFKEDQTLKDFKKQLLFYILTFINILGIPIIVISFIEAMQLNQTITAFSYLFFYTPIILITLFYKKTSYTLIVLIILTSLYLLGVINLLIYGISGAAIPIFLALMVLASLFFDFKYGLLALGLCLIPMVAIGFLFINNTLNLSVELTRITSNTTSWITAGSVLLTLGLLIVLSYGIIQIKIIQSLHHSKKQTEELKILNLKLEKDLFNQKRIEEKIKKYQEKLEELVKIRTFELEEKNKMLQINVEEMERYHKLFVEREFRIKELRDELKSIKLNK